MRPCQSVCWGVYVSLEGCEIANVLGIDLGGKAVGLAVVEQPDNRVLWCGTVHLSDRIEDLYDQRRGLSRQELSQGVLR